MKFVIQRVKQACVTVGERQLGTIGEGFLVFVGIGATDNQQIADKMIKKLLQLRIFADADGKSNLDIKATGGRLLIISQFTLYANCRKGNRPSFTEAAPPDLARALYDYIIARCTAEIPQVQAGEFGAEMQITLTNDGPYTILLDSAELP